LRNDSDVDFRRTVLVHISYKYKGYIFSLHFFTARIKPRCKKTANSYCQCEEN
jgi:hypothetical protein